MRPPLVPQQGKIVLLDETGQPIEVVLSDEEIAEISTKFQVLYYSQLNRTWGNTYYMGIPIWQSVADLWVYQELIWEEEPDLIIETGTGDGACALYFANLFDAMKSKGKVVTVDIINKPEHLRIESVLKHPRITWLIGSSLSPRIIKRMRAEVRKAKKVMIFLDSSHERNYVLKELQVYSKLLKQNEYIIVEDTNTKDVGGAVMKFLSQHSEFEADQKREKYFLTFHPMGYLRKVK